MRVFWEMVKRSFQRYLTYRAAALAGLATNFFFGLLRMAILLALYGERPQVAGLTVADVITYSALSQALIGYLSIFGWYDLMNSVYTGEIGSDLLKPLGLMRFWLAQDVGRALVNFLLRGVLIMVAFELVVDLRYPQTAVSWLHLLCTLLLGWLVSFGFRFLVNLAAFWSPDARGMGRFAFLSATFFCGQLMPIRFFPGWLQAWLNFTPFPAMFNTTIEIYLGTLTGTAVYLALLNQLLWAIGLLLLGQWVLQTAVRRLVIQGG